MIEPVLGIAVALVAALAFANGANDVSKGIATLVGSGVTDYPKAIAWGTAWTVLGGILAVVFSTAMVAAFSRGILPDNAGIEAAPTFPIAVLIGSMGWVMFASRAGLPVSTTHALIGALCGAGLMAFGWSGIQWISVLYKIAIPLAVSPFMALGLSYMVTPMTRWALSEWAGHCLCVIPAQQALLAVDQAGYVRMSQTRTELVTVADTVQCEEGPKILSLRLGPNTFHWLTSGLTSLARGLNDTPKIAALVVGSALFTGNGADTMIWLFFVVAAGMGAGGLVGGLRVTRFLAEKVTCMNHIDGFAANLTTAFLVTIAARFGLPVSTTHVSSGAIIGMGLHEGTGCIRWKTVGEMALAWVLTLPVAGLLAAAGYAILIRF